MKKKLTHEQVEAIYQKIASDEAISKSIENSASPIFRANAVISAVIKGLKSDPSYVEFVLVKKVISKLIGVQEIINDEGRKMSASEREASDFHNPEWKYIALSEKKLKDAHPQVKNVLKKYKRDFDNLSPSNRYELLNLLSDETHEDEIRETIDQFFEDFDQE